MHKNEELRAFVNVTVKEEYFRLTNDFYHALVLTQFDSCQQLAMQIDRSLEQENARSEKHDQDPVFISLTEGWFYKPIGELRQELLHPCSTKKLSLIVTQLLEKEWIETRRHPGRKFDTTKQYRLNFPKLREDLFNAGLSFPGWVSSVLYPIPAHLTAIVMPGQKEVR